MRVETRTRQHRLSLEVEGHYYSVPYALVKQQLEVRLSAQVVEIFHKGNRVASHQRSRLKGRHSTVAAHMPKAHRRYAQWTPQRLVHWAAHSGPATAQVVETILASRPHPQQGFRACLGIMRLGKSYGDERLEAACRRALTLGACSYKSIESILKLGLDRHLAAKLCSHTCRPPCQYPWPPVLPKRPRRTLMLHHPTDKLQALRRTGWITHSWSRCRCPRSPPSAEERLGLLVDREPRSARTADFTARLRQAKLRQAACLEDLDYRQPRGWTKP